MRTAVVTGGGTGIGRAIALEFVKQGLDVTITGRRASVLAEVPGVRHVAFDATDPDAVAGALESLPSKVDVLVNNAGGNVGHEDTKTRWLANYEANVVSAVLVTEALAPRLADNGRVITIGSIAGRRGGGSYGAAKAAVEAWTADLAGELGGRGITANVVSPGLIVDTEFFGDSMTGERLEMLIGQTKNGRAGTPEDVAALVGFLGSEAAGHITGQVLAVNGGAHLGR
ncbi:SDR family NAD(P)-dependent oxidoreductase [Lentzea aerocolonigenes]|uniref:SDR family NAD(P)-dependent oxidoreductase n=1 Tax=Lentzea aerocolonigenes TaxID=68170 RepID=UPI0004C3F362|nr:SDR family oxidoreductase [Lentzea aerocolonigenes]MCP2250633.1 3-oxoacyl-[acyl-carrier protein] reductase [Lentzea aerocolonigenes]